VESGAFGDEADDFKDGYRIWEDSHASVSSNDSRSPVRCMAFFFSIQQSGLTYRCPFRAVLRILHELEGMPSHLVGTAIPSQTDSHSHWP